MVGGFGTLPFRKVAVLQNMFTRKRHKVLEPYHFVRSLYDGSNPFEDDDYFGTLPFRKVAVLGISAD